MTTVELGRGKHAVYSVRLDQVGLIARQAGLLAELYIPPFDGMDTRVQFSCVQCHEDLPLCATDIDLVGKWHGGVADWLDTQGVNGQYLSPLQTLLLGEEIQALTQELSELRRSLHSNDLTRYTEADLETMGHLVGINDFSTTGERAYRLPWTARLQEAFLS